MFNTKIPLYGIFIIIAILCGLCFIYKNAKVLKLQKEEVTGLLIYIVLGAVFGAKTYTFFTNYRYYKGIFEFSKVGLSSYGAVIGIIIMLLLFAKQYKKKFKDLIYIIIPAIPLMYGIGKIGCFLAGCCYGIKYDGPFNVIYKYSLSAPKGVKLFPIQLLEAIVFLLIFIYVTRIIKRKDSRDIVIGQTFIICGIAKFLLEYLRMSHINVIISINQIFSLVFIIVGICLLIIKKK